MTGNFEMKIVENQAIIHFQVGWRVNLRKIGCERLSEAQQRALEEYCGDLLPNRLAMADLSDPVTITPCEIYRTGENNDKKKNGTFYDAETGELYTGDKILDGKHEIRLRNTGTRDQSGK